MVLLAPRRGHDPGYSLELLGPYPKLGRCLSWFSFLLIVLVSAGSFGLLLSGLGSTWVYLKPSSQILEMSSPPIGDKRVEIFPDLIPGSKPIPPGLVDAGSLLMVSLVDTCPVEAFGDFTSVLGGDGFSLSPLSKVPARVSLVKEPLVASRKRMGTISLGRLGAMFRRVVTKGFGVGVVPGMLRRG